jgi:hypothetical protein
MLMHASLTASTFILGPLAVSGVALLTYDLGLAGAMWVCVLGLAVVRSRAGTGHGRGVPGGLAPAGSG